jgi:hypothetical protein
MSTDCCVVVPKICSRRERVEEAGGGSGPRNSGRCGNSKPPPRLLLGRTGSSGAEGKGGGRWLSFCGRGMRLGRWPRGGEPSETRELVSWLVLLLGAALSGGRLVAGGLSGSVLLCPAGTVSPVSPSCSWPAGPVWKGS